MNMSVGRGQGGHNRVTSNTARSGSRRHMCVFVCVCTNENNDLREVLRGAKGEVVNGASQQCSPQERLTVTTSAGRRRGAGEVGGVLDKGGTA